MRAIVSASRPTRLPGPLGDRPAALVAVANRPAVQWVVELLVEAGVEEFDFILGWHPERVEAFLGDGTRWGSRFRYHLVADPERPYAALSRALGPARPGVVFLAAAEELPQRPPRIEAVGLWVRPEAPGPEGWTGWGVVPASVLSRCPDDLDAAGLAAHLAGAAAGIGLEAVPTARTDTPAALLEAQRQLLSGELPVRPSCRQVEPGVWVEPNARVAGSARITGPAYVGEHARLGAGVQVGPNTVIGSNCVIDDGVAAVESCIEAGTYVGPGLELRAMLACPGGLVSAHINAAIEVPDAFLLGDLRLGGWVARLGRLWSRVGGCLALLATAPLLAATALCLALTRGGPVLHRRPVVRLPAPPVAGRWKTYHLWTFRQPGRAGRAGWRGQVEHLTLDLVPALANVARGHLQLVGVAPRSREQTEALDPDWRALYLQSKAGLITEAQHQFGPAPTADELRASETLYAATRSLRLDARLAAGYLAVLLGLRRGRRSV
ncbi:MAG: NDP-sugar synthase [Gemmatimonadota bacterium]